MSRENFRSRLGFILVSAGCAIGIGNVWKFPYVTGVNGGGVFVLFYIISLVIMGGSHSDHGAGGGPCQPEKCSGRL